MTPPALSCTAFAGDRCIASGDRAAVALAVKRTLEWGEDRPVLVFEDATGRAVDFDLRGSAEEVLARLAEPEPEAPREAARGPGRPKLGVVAREVTLLPRHWDWLAAQPGGASVALRKLVEQARSAPAPAERMRVARDAAYRFMSAMAGNLVDFEEAARALYAGEKDRFEALTQPWPSDIRDHARRLAASGFEPQASSTGV